MKRVSLFLILSLFFSAAVAEGTTTGNVNVFLGGKTLDSDWAPYDEQGELGVLIDVQPGSWPVSIAVDMLVSADVADYGWIQETVSTSEFDLGVRKVFNLEGSSFHPYVGGGLALISARYEAVTWLGTFSDEDGAAGLWLNGGFFVTLGDHFNIGLDLRYSSADITLLNMDLDAGGSHGGLLLGYHW